MGKKVSYCGAFLWYRLVFHNYDTILSIRIEGKSILKIN